LILSRLEIDQKIKHTLSNYEISSVGGGDFEFWSGGGTARRSPREAGYRHGVAMVVGQPPAGAADLGPLGKNNFLMSLHPNEAF